MSSSWGTYRKTPVASKHTLGVYGDQNADDIYPSVSSSCHFDHCQLLAKTARRKTHTHARTCTHTYTYIHNERTHARTHAHALTHVHTDRERERQREEEEERGGETEHSRKEKRVVTFHYWFKTPRQPR